MKNKYEIRGNDVIIFVNGYDKVWECIIDLEDFEKVSSIPNKWYIAKGKYDSIYVYYQTYINEKRTSIKLHQFLMGTFGKGKTGNIVVDHKDGDQLNNRRNNLQITTQLVNVHKAKVMKTNKLGVKHIRFRKDRNKYQVQFERQRKNIHVGYFDTLDEAIEARDNYLSQEVQ